VVLDQLSVIVVKEDDGVWYYKYTCSNPPSVIIETKIENLRGSDIKKMVGDSCFLMKNNTLMCMSIDKLGKIKLNLEHSDIIDASSGLSYFHLCIVKINGTVLCRGNLYYPN